MIRPDPAKIIVPRKHAQLLIEPPLTALAHHLKSPPPPRGGDKLQTYFNAPLEQLRTLARSHLIQCLNQWSKQIGTQSSSLGPQSPIVMTGHQLEFYHAGVWAKVIATDELAKRTNAIAVDVLVDHDIVDHPGFEVPYQESENADWQKKHINFAPASLLPADSLSAPTGEQFDQWESELANYPLAHADALSFFLTQLCQLEATNSYTAWLSRARSNFEKSQGLSIHHVPTSLLCTGPLWQTFLTAWIENADSWTTAYNSHLSTYRKNQGIKNDAHPMPNLTRKNLDDGATQYELPFWIYKKGHPRQRLFIKKQNNKTTLLCSKCEHDSHSGLSTKDSGLNIRPRALTLTMYLRLFLADLFIHGIGGALYDQITDALMQELFGIVPSYACVSAAWLLPIAQTLESAADVPSLQSKRHHLLHNPQLIPNSPRDLLNTRSILFQEISTSLSTSRKDPTARQLRQEKFHQLHALNKKLHTLTPEPLRFLDEKITTALRTRQQNQVLFHREYFFALHTEDSLQKLIQKIRAS